MSVNVMANLYASDTYFLSKRIQISWPTNLSGYGGHHRGQGQKEDWGTEDFLAHDPELQLEVKPIIVQYQTTANFVVTN